ncbi:MAG: bifunctional DNA-formamidopyrimidine glycosylase/DNA-(apurinic or apyrimidinic site) lyase [Dehalococcoidales bacterium]|nr:MAG: bifunctional DNA-formamidopyrimidine glycosylase/DNA-(apurinic or apyrimidinic site) lyase [Dehalococcoidales bacterium]
MPELPEVETVRNELTPHIIGRRITGLTFEWDRIVKKIQVEDFERGVIGQEILALDRRGKYLIFSLSSGDYMIIHLKMTGSLLVQKKEDELPRFTRAVIHLDNDTDIVFRDPRKFGVMRLVDDPEPVIGKLGPEPLKDDFTIDVFRERLLNRKAPMKALLCDQNVIAGIGSMYADEVMFDTGIYPVRLPESLSDKEKKHLYKAIRRILYAAIENKGASVNTYYRPDGSEGTAHFEFNVAHRGGQPCNVCGTPIERMVVRGRGTYYCPKCQADKSS